MKLGTEVLKNYDLPTLEAKVNESVQLINAAFANFHQVEVNFQNYFAQDFSTLPYHYHADNCDEVISAIKRVAWRFVIQKLQIKDFISTKKRKELDQKIERNEMPNFTAREVALFITDASQNVNNLVTESAKEVFNFIKPNWTGLKTNEFSKGMPPKVIIPYVMDTWYSRAGTIDYRQKDRLKDLDNLFHLMDGNGVSQYPGDIVTAIESTKDSNSAETKYFKLTWYKNGNLHVEFKRMDLLNKLAQMGSENTLFSN